MKKTIYLFLPILTIVFLTTGCGTVSGIKDVGSKPVDLSPFNRVLVQDFTDGASGKVGKNREAKASQIQRVALDFADMIQSEIEQKRIFEEVLRTGSGVPNTKTLLVGGQITKYEEGSPAMRLMIGLGAGSADFKALVEFRSYRKDGPGDLVGNLIVNKYSWVGGGAISAQQTPEQFMKEAAKKVAEELERLKGK